MDNKEMANKMAGKTDEWIAWLLDSPTPSIRYLTLRDLLEMPEDDQDLRAAWVAMKEYGPIPKMLDQQSEEGHWVGEHSYYTPKYISTHWSLMLLSELAVDGSDPRFRRGVAYMLDATQDRLGERLGEREHGLECFYGNLLRYALHAAYLDDPRVEEIVEYLVRAATLTQWRCEHQNELSCVWGAARALWGLAALPPGYRTAEIGAAINQALEWTLGAHHLVEADYPTPKGKIHALWSRMNFPLFYQADILFVLRVLAELGALDHPTAVAAIDWLRARRNKNGRWRGSNPYRQRTWAALSQDKEDTNRWVTLQAALVLQRAKVSFVGL